MYLVKSGWIVLKIIRYIYNQTFYITKTNNIFNEESVNGELYDRAIIWNLVDMYNWRRNKHVALLYLTAESNYEKKF